MYDYFPMLWIVLVPALLIAVPATISGLRARAKGFQIAVPLLAAAVLVAVVASMIFTANLIKAQDIKDAEVIKGRAANVEKQIKEQHKLAGDGDEILNDVVSASYAINQFSSSLSEGKPVTFQSDSGKFVTVRFSPSTKGDEYYNAEVLYDGKRLESASGTYKETGQVSENSKKRWANSYPFLDPKPVGVQVIGS